MTIDELATAATEDLLHTARVRTDVTARRRALDHTLTVRRRGWTATAAAAAAILALVLSATFMASPRSAPPAHDPRKPVQYTGNGPILVSTSQGYELVDPATGTTTHVELGQVDGMAHVGWSPDGAHVAFFDGLRTPVIDIRTGRTTYVSAPEDPALGWYPLGRITWSTDGTFSDEGVDVVAAVRDSLPHGTRILEASWSPDGTKIVIGTWDDAGDRRLYVVSSDGTAMHQLPARAAPEDEGPYAPLWSPDGTRIVYKELAPPGQEDSSFTIMTIRPDGTDRMVVADGGSALGVGKWETYLAWSPDSRKVAFLADFAHDNSGMGLYVTDLLGVVTRVPIDGRVVAPALAWQPVP